MFLSQATPLNRNTSFPLDYFRESVDGDYLFFWRCSQRYSFLPIQFVVVVVRWLFTWTQLLRQAAAETYFSLLLIFLANTHILFWRATGLHTHKIIPKREPSSRHIFWLWQTSNDSSTAPSQEDRHTDDATQSCIFLRYTDLPSWSLLSLETRFFCYMVVDDLPRTAKSFSRWSTKLTLLYDQHCSHCSWIHSRRPRLAQQKNFLLPTGGAPGMDWKLNLATYQREQILLTHLAVLAVDCTLKCKNVVCLQVFIDFFLWFDT